MDVSLSDNTCQGDSEMLLRFRRDEGIIHEGDQDDHFLYLLQKGSVGVYRTIDNTEIFIERIDAVNFFGEIEIFTGGPRLGSVRAITDEVIAYRFLITDQKNVSMPEELGKLLISRLSFDLKEYSNRFMKNEACINRLLDEKDASLENAAILILSIEKVLEHLIVSHRTSQIDVETLAALKNLMEIYIPRKLPQINLRLQSEDQINYKTLYEENLIPENLVKILLK